MAFDTLSPAQFLQAMLENILGTGAAQLGVPESIPKRLYAVLTAGGQTPTTKATGVIRRAARYNCTLVYRTDSGEAAAEAALMTALDDFLEALYADRSLGGVAKDIEIDCSLADTPEYQVRAGKEFREFPVIVTVFQDGSYDVNP